MSPFETTSDRLALRIRGLGRKGQVALLACSAEALLPRYLDWSAASGGLMQDDLLRDAVESAMVFATGETWTPAGSMLQLVEAATPSEPSDVPWFTAAQDSWICVDAALRVASGDFDAPDASWYLLESMFQSVSESLFGLSDVGSQAQDASEAEALADPRLRNAVAALDQAIDLLEGEQHVDVGVLDRVRAILSPIRP